MNETAHTGPDGFVVAPEDPLAPAHLLLDGYLEDRGDEYLGSGRHPSATPGGAAILEAPPEMRAAVLRAGLIRTIWLRAQGADFPHDEYRDAKWEKKPCPELDAKMLQISRRIALHRLMGVLLERSLPFSEADVADILRTLGGSPEEPVFDSDMGPIPGLVPALGKFFQRRGEGGVPPEMRPHLQRLREGLNEFNWWAGFKKSVGLLDELLGSVEEGLPQPGEAWADAVIATVSGMAGEERDRWKALVAHAPVANKHQPTAKWLEQARKLIAPLDSELDAALAGWLEVVGQGASAAASDRNADYLKGLFWYASLRESEAVARAVATAAEGSLRKVTGGLYCSRAFKSALYALGQMPGGEPVAQLLRLKQRIKSPWGKEQLAEALDAAMLRSGLTEADLEEITLPDFGLRDGRREEAVGEYTATLSITGTTEVTLTWRDSEGREVAKLPSAFQKAHAAEIKEVKRGCGEIEKMLAAQRGRLERILIGQRRWPYAEWRKRYLDHPLIGSLCRRLIWRFTDAGASSLGVCLEGELVDASGQPISTSDGCEVTLWHPLESSAETVQAWRTFLEAKGIAQPFKQAHREIYLLTDAERTTSTYSNRFAGHVLRQHQLAALARERGWQYDYLGTWDTDDFGACLKLPGWDLAAEFTVDAAGGGEERSEAGVLLYVSTDRIQFLNPGGGVRPLEEVPALIFSEVMRDVDLFVGVASIGADPQWRDRGPDERVQAFDEYWQHYSFGDLSATAVVRREVLSRLLPRLKIADRCSLEDRYLRVRGDRGAYKIHLRSGNVLMEPNDQYLCIVQDRGANSSRVLLPFEGDSMLSVILSKAFMLAEDTRITDPSILGQLRRQGGAG